MKMLKPGDAGYSQEISGFNLAVTHRPEVVVPAVSVADVIDAVRYAGDAGMPVTVGSTGHAPGLAADGGLLLSTRHLGRVTVDAAARSARVRAGAVWRDVIGPASSYGLAPLSGSSSGVGVMGYLLGGGIGLLSRAHGFAADLVRELEIVTADGRLRQVSQDREPELFWALRGGKAAPGVVVSATFDLLPYPSVYGGNIVYSAAHAGTLLAAYLEWTDGLDERTNSSIALLRPPSADPIVAIRVAHTGPDGDAVVAPLLAAAPPLAVSLGEVPYRETDAICQDPTDPVPAWGRSVLLSRAETDEAVTALLEADPALPVLELRQLGGAMSRPVDNACAGREAAFSLSVHAVAVPALIAAGDALLSGFGTARVHPNQLNLTGPALLAQLERAWPAPVAARLDAVARRYDPDGMFRFGYRHTD